MTGLHHRLRAAAGASSGATLPTFVSSSINRVTTAGNTVTAPTGIQNGDLLVAIGKNVNSSITFTLPTGFVYVFFNNTTDNSYFIATKVAASESGNYTFTSSSSANNTVAILVYRNATRCNTIGNLSRTVSTETQTASEITPTYSGTLLAAFGCENNRTVTTAPSDMTQRATQTANSPTFVIYDQSPQAATATGDKSLTWSSGGIGGPTSILLQITNEPDIEPDFIASAQAQLTSSSVSLTIDKPTGTLEGDLMIAVMASGTNSTWTGDTDWVEVADQGGRPCLRVAYKVAGSSEGSNYTFTQSASGNASGCILTYRYAAYDAIGSFATATDPLVIAAPTAADSQSILITSASRQNNSVTMTAPAGMTVRVTDADASTPSYRVFDQANPKGLAGVQVTSGGATTNVAGISLVIKPTRSL